VQIRRQSIVDLMAGADLETLAARYSLEGAERWNDAIVVAKRHRTGVVLLDRPETGNAHNRAMIQALGRAWLHMGDDDEGRVIVIGATTERNFCTGIDLKEVAGAGGFAGLWANNPYGPVRGSGQTHRDAGILKPVVAAIEGRTIGGGLHWVAEADIVIAGEGATFRDTHVERGFVGNRENLDLALKAGLGAALYLSLVGGQVQLDAPRALSLGLVQEVVPSGTALSRAFELADIMARNSPTAMARQLETLWNVARMHHEEAVSYGRNLLRWQQEHPDSTEGAVAFAERREPNWQPLQRD
jgi:E-phenylitaconyl-CoA hydratase